MPARRTESLRDGAAVPALRVQQRRRVEGPLRHVQGCTSSEKCPYAGHVLRRALGKTLRDAGAESHAKRLALLTG